MNVEKKTRKNKNDRVKMMSTHFILTHSLTIPLSLSLSVSVYHSHYILASIALTSSILLIRPIRLVNTLTIFTICLSLPPPQNHMVQLISLWFYLYLRSEYLVSTICFNFVVEHISHWVYSCRARIQAFIAYTHHFVCQFSSQKLTYTHNCILIFAKIVAVYFKN